MLDQLFSRPKAVEQLAQGPLAEHLEGFCRWLGEQGYSRSSLCRFVAQASHLSRYLKKREVPRRGLERSHIRHFLKEHLPRCQCPLVWDRKESSASRSLNCFLNYLSAQGLAVAAAPESPPAVYQALLEGYLEHLRRRQLAAGTIRLRRRCLVQFLSWLGTEARPEKLAQLANETVHRFFLQYAQKRGRAARRSMQATLRTFFRFCLQEGLTGRDLAEAVPTLRTYKLARLPRGISEQSLAKLLSSIDRNTSLGRRDWAILQLLATYGVRGEQVRSLRLQDIDWGRSQIRFPALKDGKPVTQPLTEEVGNGLLEYLSHARPPCAWPQVFLRARAPWRPLKNSSSLSAIVAGRLRAAGIALPSRGAHALRHAFACRMLRHGQPLKAIADMLGHRCLQSSFIYTKVDFPALQQVPLGWPEVLP